MRFLLLAPWGRPASCWQRSYKAPEQSAILWPRTKPSQPNGSGSSLLTRRQGVRLLPKARNKYGSIAPMARAAVLQSAGCRFESDWIHQASVVSKDSTALS